MEQGARRPTGQPRSPCRTRRRGREWAESSFAWPIVARKHLEFFETILDGPNSRIA